MPLAGKVIVALLKRYGWKHVRTKGSHLIMAKGKKTIPVPVHGNKSLGKGLENKILKEAGIRKQDLKKAGVKKK